MTRDRSTRQQRSFGLIVGTGFAVIGLWPLIWRGESARVWALTVAVVLVGFAFLAPRQLEPVRRVWMRIGETLGWVNSRIILTVVYYVVIVPIAVVRRLRGDDPMRRSFDRDLTTYRLSRQARPASHLRRQY